MLSLDRGVDWLVEIMSAERTPIVVQAPETMEGTFWKKITSERGKRGIERGDKSKPREVRYIIKPKPLLIYRNNTTHFCINA